MTQLAYSPKSRNYKGRPQKSWILQGNTPSLCHLGDGMGFNWFIAHVKQGWTRHLGDGMGFDWFLYSSREARLDMDWTKLHPCSHWLASHLQAGTQFVPYPTHSDVALSAKIPFLWCYLIVTLTVFFLWHCHFQNQG
jgi:hypothetical protein